MRKILPILVVMLLAASSVAADNTKTPSQLTQLPAFKVSDPNGSAVDIKDVAPAGKWLLIYVNSGSRASDMMLSLMTADKYASYLDHMVIIAGGVKPDQISEWTAKYPDLARAHWLADPDRASFKALGLHGAPVEIGLKDSSIGWVLSGMPAGQTSFDSILTDWLKAQ